VVRGWQVTAFARVKQPRAAHEFTHPVIPNYKRGYAPFCFNNE